MNYLSFIFFLLILIPSIFSLTLIVYFHLLFDPYILIILLILIKNMEYLPLS